jgi:hypothetical protein
MPHRDRRNLAVLQLIHQKNRKNRKNLTDSRMNQQQYRKYSKKEGAGCIRDIFSFKSKH